METFADSKYLAEEKNLDRVPLENQNNILTL
jgi:hypothetical protein